MWRRKLDPADEGSRLRENIVRAETELREYDLRHPRNRVVPHISLQVKPALPALKIVLICFAIIFVIMFVPLGGFATWDSWVFTHMTTAQHLFEAQRALQTSGDVELALRHIEAIPGNAPEAKEAKALRKIVEQKMAAKNAAAGQAQNAANAAVQAHNAAVQARALAVDQVSSDLRNLGYQLTVETSTDVPTEVVITSADFDDTDHRVRFLSFIRGRKGPKASLCWNGFNDVRLRSSKIPLLGFNERYSLDCGG